MNVSGLSAQHLDALKEISNIGMGHAATALSQLLGESIFIRVPEVSVTDLAQVPDLIGGAEMDVAGVSMQILGDARGSILLIFPRQSASQLIRRLLGRETRNAVFDEMEASTMKEVANILASAYLSALGSLMNITLIPSIPMLSQDMVGAIIDHLLIELAENNEMALMMKAEFYDRSQKDRTMEGHFFLLPAPQSLQVLLKAVGLTP